MGAGGGVSERAACPNHTGVFITIMALVGMSLRGKSRSTQERHIRKRLQTTQPPARSDMAKRQRHVVDGWLNRAYIQKLVVDRQHNGPLQHAATFKNAWAAWTIVTVLRPRSHTSQLAERDGAWPTKRAKCCTTLQQHGVALCC